MKSIIFYSHRIKERTMEELKAYFHPKTFIEYCKECEYYNKIWTCPPYDFDLEKHMEGYEFAYIIGSKLYTDELGDDFKELLDKKEIERVASEIYKAARVVLDEKLDKLSELGNQLCVLYAGRCLMCDHCTREKQLPCALPHKKYFSLESIGFDVVSICKYILEDKILWAKEEMPEYFLLVSAVFSRERLRVEDIYNTMLDK